MRTVIHFSSMLAELQDWISLLMDMPQLRMEVRGSSAAVSQCWVLPLCILAG